MSPLSLDDARNMPGATMLDSSGSKIGKVTDVHVDDDTQTPEWALVQTGPFGARESFVPLAQAQLRGNELTGLGPAHHRRAGAGDGTAGPGPGCR